MKHFKVIFKPDSKQTTIHAGATLTDAAAQAGIVLNSTCGGKGICGKCTVILEPDKQEVLACQHCVDSDLEVTIPATSRFFEHKILTSGVSTQEKVHPTVSQKYLDLDTAGGVFGLSVDIGTTTVVAKLIDMADGHCVATQAALNPQIRYGDDVVSRISYGQTEKKLAELHEIIVGCLNELISGLCGQASIEAADIYEMCVVGNTTMSHIFLKFPVTQLGQAPYKAYSLDAHDVSADKISLTINSEANIHTVANIAGFVGSDTTAVAVAVGMDSVEEMSLVVDIGTNGEIILGTKDKLYATSCAAGPAFEGARIDCGSRAVEGAIEGVVINGNDIDLDVIGSSGARSICGSGLIDAVAVLLDLGIVDGTGCFVKSQKLCGQLPSAIFSRITQVNDQPAFCLAGTNDGGQRVVLTQRDIRQVQLAKAAIRAGIKLLQKKIGIEDADIKQVFLAGAFGNYIRAKSALRIGLLPNLPLERIHFVGNAASAGAQMILISHKYRKLAQQLAQKIEYIELANEADFTDVYAEAMLF